MVVQSIHWLQECESCKCKHRVMLKDCPTCHTYETPQPVSENVANKCNADYSCDGCIVYREHISPYYIEFEGQR